MKKVININFQGRVIPIEESAYEALKLYVESLRRYFANEEGRDEIINDIEGRIAELFSERLKKGATCITDEDVNNIIANMGRPEDFEAQDADMGTSTGSSTSSGPEASQQGQQQQSYTYTSAAGSRKLVRNADDKILGGVCSGLANYLNIDPVVMRIIFVVLFGALFWVYILLWIIVPSQSVQTNITKRLYRNPDDKVIAGVCGGLAAYFNIDTWVPRLIFALPLIVALISGSFNAIWWDWDFGFVPRVISSSLGSTLFLTYVVLWIAVPVASTAAEKLEMKGEQINLNSIRNTVKEDLESFRSRAEKWGAEVKESAEQFGQKARNFGETAGTHARNFAAEAAPAARRTGNGLGHVIGVLFKAFFLFIAAIVAITLFCVFIAILFGSFAIFPLKNFLLDGFVQNMLAWLTLFLFMGIPIVALITWLVRRIIGVRSKNHYLGYVFGSLWFIGLVSAITLSAMITRNFSSRAPIEERVMSFSPSDGKLRVEAERRDVRYYGSDWFGVDFDGEWPIYGINQDSIMLNTIRVNVVKSLDSAYHVYHVKFARGNTAAKARSTAERIEFPMQRSDNQLMLPQGFAVSKNEKFRNQQVLVVIEVPVGKRIELDKSLDRYNWFTLHFNRNRGWSTDWDNDWDNTYGWTSNVEYMMTPDGLQRADRLDPDELRRGRFQLRIDQNGKKLEVEGVIDGESPAKNDSIRRDNRYRYERERSTDEGRRSNTEAEGYEDEVIHTSGTSELGTPLTVFARLFQ